MSSNNNLLSGLPPLDGHGSDDTSAMNDGSRNGWTRADRPNVPPAPLPAQGATSGSARLLPPAPPTPNTSASQTYTPYGGQAALGQTMSHRAVRPASTAEGSAMTGGTAMAGINGRILGEDDYARSNAGEYVPGGDAGSTGGLSLTKKQRAVTPATTSWAAVSAMMERPDQGNATRVMPAIGSDITASQDPPTIEDLLNSGSLLDACKSEFDRVSRELDELRMLVKQSSKEMEKLNQRKVLTAATVREIEEHMEHHSRQDIRAAYLAASEAEMRAFMISEQREQMETKLRVFERYGAFLSRTIIILSELPEPGASPFMDAGAAWNLPTAGPALGITGAPAWYPDQVADPAVSALAPLGAPSPGHDLATITRVIDAQESVRQRVAQRLHDGPTQSLANVVLTAEICEKLVQSDPRRALSELANLKGLVNTTLQETRKFIFELRPMTLDDLGLAATLRRYTTDIATRYRIQAQVTAPYAEQPLPKEVEVPVFRVAQEAVMNAVEHSRATIIQVTLAVSLEGVMLVVDDNGSGFDVEDALTRAMARETTGIPNMQDRAELLGGWLRIESMRGRGSRVELAIPLDPKR